MCRLFLPLQWNRNEILIKAEAERSYVNELILFLWYRVDRAVFVFFYSGIACEMANEEVLSNVHFKSTKTI